MSLRLTIFIALAASAGLFAQEPLPLTGRLQDSTYHSATGRFSVEVPVLPELGGRIVDTENVVTFEDDFNTHFSIACFAQDLTQRWELDTRGRNDYLLYFFTSFILPEFESRYPGSTIESSRYLAALQGGTLMIAALLPGGSYFEGRNNLLGGNSQPPAVAKRGVFLFVRNQSVFVVTTELAERVVHRRTFDKSPAEENEMLRQRLEGLLSKMRFPASQSNGGAERRG